MRSSRILLLVLSGYLCAISADAGARNFDVDIEVLPEHLVAVEQAQPDYPGSGVRKGQEGWVRIHFVVTADGRATDPVVVDSVGGVEFEKSVNDIISLWRFEPTGQVTANARADIRFEIYRGRDLATSNFLRRYRTVVQHLFDEEYAEARQKVDETAALGGWNLYESTMLWLMIGRVEGVEGNDTGKLEAYRRALGIGNHQALDLDNRKELLSKTFELEMGQSQYAAARSTLAELRRLPDSESELEKLGALVDELSAQLGSESPIVAHATLCNPSDAPDGMPLWSYAPLRQTFSFAALNGNVERFEVRCERDRLEGPVEPGKAWSVPDSATNCRLFVFGDDGASFDFVEYPEEIPVDANAKAAVAINDVLDRRSQR